MAIDLQPVTLGGTTPDAEGRLVFRDGRLMAVLACLSGLHGEQQGRWFVEAVFGDLPEPPGRIFSDLSAVAAWADRSA